MTGKWRESEDAAELLKMDEEDDEEVFGDFEDLETGEKVQGKGCFTIIAPKNDVRSIFIILQIE